MVQRNLGLCCLCIPLQLGTQLLTCWTFFYSFFCLVALMSGDIRLLDAGYNTDTARLSAYAGCAGFAFGLVGIIGAYNNQLTPLRIYNVYQILKILLSFYVMYKDIVALRNCAVYANVIYSQVEFNAALESISRKALCDWGLRSYVIGATVHRMVDFYFTYVTYVYTERLAQNPLFLINFGGPLGVDGVVPWQNTKISEGTHLLIKDIKGKNMERVRGYKPGASAEP